MRIVVEAVGNRVGGGGLVLLETIQALLGEPRFTEVVLLCSPRIHRGFDLPVDSRLRVLEQSGPHSSMSRRIWWLEHGAAQVANREQADRMLLLNGAGRAPADCPVISFVQQALPLTPASWESSHWRVRLRMNMLQWLIKRGTRRASRVAVQRVGMRALLVEMFGLSSSQIDIFEPGPPPFPEAEDPARKLSQMSQVPHDRRILYVGSNEPHKNLRLAASSVGKIQRLMPGATLFATCLPPEDVSDINNVCWLGSLSRGEVRRAYALASVLAMPSKVESLGLPLLEAMALGVPVLAADLNYAREVCENAAVFFDPMSAEDAAAKLGELLTDTKLQCRLRDSGKELIKKRTGANAYKKLARRLADLA